MKRLEICGGRRLLPLVLAALVGLGSTLSACVAGSDSRPTEADIAAVYCLSPSEGPRLVDAAEALDLARPGSAPDRIRTGDADMSLETWRRTNRADFDRSCAALRAASHTGADTMRPGNDLTSVLLVLLPAVVGALVAWLAGERRDATARNRSSAEALRLSATEFLHACDNFVLDWTASDRVGRPDDERLNDTRRDLAAQLQHSQTLRPGWIEPQRLQETLHTTLGHHLSGGWLSQDEQARQVRAAQISSQARKLHASVDRLAYSIERSFLPGHVMFRRSRPNTSEHKDVEATS